MDSKGIGTKLIHGGDVGALPTRDITPPIHLSSSYDFETIEDAQRAFSGDNDGAYVYGRVHNPTQRLLETRLADIEGGEDAAVVASGIAAISSLFLSVAKPGDQIISHNCLYGNTFRFLSQAMAHQGVSVKFVNMLDLQAVEKELSARTKFFFLETPTNPFLEVLDVGRISEMARATSALCVVDSTLASPILQQPLHHGADVVIHSLSKYIGGHGDLLGGVVIGAVDTIGAVRKCGLRYLTGATVSPFSCYLALRGLKTLKIRMAAHSLNGEILANFLQNSKLVEDVYYPTKTSDNCSLEIREKYMKNGGGGVVSFRASASMQAISKGIDQLLLFKRAVSLGTCESLIEHPGSMTHSAYNSEHEGCPEIPENLVRLSVGLEDHDDIIDDLTKMFKFAEKLETSEAN